MVDCYGLAAKGVIAELRAKYEAADKSASEMVGGADTGQNEGGVTAIVGYGLLKVLNDLQVDLEVFNASPVPPNALSKQQSLILKYQAEDLQRLQQFVESLLDRFLKSIAKVWQNVTQNIKTMVACHLRLRCLRLVAQFALLQVDSALHWLHPLAVEELSG